MACGKSGNYGNLENILIFCIQPMTTWEVCLPVLFFEMLFM